MSLSWSHRENEEERLYQTPTFLTKLQEIMAIIDEEVLPNIKENTHLRLMNELQHLYDLHTETKSSCERRNFTSSITSSTSTNFSNFTRLLSELDTEYNGWTDDTKDAYDNSVNPNNSYEVRTHINTLFSEFSKYNRQVREALGYWRAMSFEEQTNICWGPHINDPSRNMMSAVVWGGPIDRIIVARTHDHPVEIYDVNYDM